MSLPRTSRLTSLFASRGAGSLSALDTPSRPPLEHRIAGQEGRVPEGGHHAPQEAQLGASARRRACAYRRGRTITAYIPGRGPQHPAAQRRAGARRPDPGLPRRALPSRQGALDLVRVWLPAHHWIWSPRLRALPRRTTQEGSCLHLANPPHHRAVFHADDQSEQVRNQEAKDSIGRLSYPLVGGVKGGSGAAGK